MITVKELKECKNATEDLIETVKEEIEDACSAFDERNYLEDGFEFEKDGVSYSVIEVAEGDWDDQGKYQYQDLTYQLVSFDKSVEPFAYDKNIIDKFDVFLNLSVIRSGSYFSDYYYQYETPEVQIAKIKHIPEQIIPAHDRIEFVDVEQ